MYTFLPEVGRIEARQMDDDTREPAVEDAREAAFAFLSRPSLSNCLAYGSARKCPSKASPAIDKVSLAGHSGFLLVDLCEIKPRRRVSGGDAAIDLDDPFQVVGFRVGRSARSAPSHNVHAEPSEIVADQHPAACRLRLSLRRGIPSKARRCTGNAGSSRPGGVSRRDESSTACSFAGVALADGSFASSSRGGACFDGRLRVGFAGVVHFEMYPLRTQTPAFP